MHNGDIIIRRRAPGKWYTHADCGTECPVTVRLADRGWSFIPDNNIYNGEYTISVRIRQDDYEVTTNSSGYLTIRKIVGDGYIGEDINELSIPRGIPAIRFFQMTGMGKDGVQRTVCIDHTLNQQLYGTGANG